ncbi:ethanolamine ammonia-lyase reactivating factor EutA [Robertmurraya korlensis]|uniref:ethanolamine ammonia-lyase reactivating factor EutA n=1 Tax=Robertmurraya korlensis TaxID=519977 RepID=UPI000826DEB8|nr:ethanolamine ammonia-lyase reactivating factor EutA [Robertmurraya korlensis]
MGNWITSIGLDIGTSTTKFIVSHLSIAEQGSPFHLPTSQIIDRTVVYASSIYTTPLTSNHDIDMESLLTILSTEYEQSGIHMKDVKAGAVIITGETARKENAEKIINYLADRAGDFVVATAGADLEGILAGKGSGAKVRSEEIEGIVANVDIGGGTANVALFEAGRAIQTFTFHVGGRLIRINDQEEVVYISEYVRPWLEANCLSHQTGKGITFHELKELCTRMNQSMISFLSGKPKYHADLLLVEPIDKPLPLIKEIIFSGGVGHMMAGKEPSQINEVTTFGDIGPLLASTLLKVSKLSGFHLINAKETTRATVIGAGMQNTEISGATVFVQEDLLPIKNLPIVRIMVDTLEFNAVAFTNQLDEVIKQARRLYEVEDPPFALGLLGMDYCSYQTMKSMTSTICQLFHQHFPNATCLVVICESDIGKALGQSLKKTSHEGMQIICIDQVDFLHGDYIDLGFRTAGEAISLSVKTLAFG